MRQHFPLTAGFVQVKDGVDHLAYIGGAFPTRARTLREQWRNPFPGFVTDIAWVWFS